MILSRVVALWVAARLTEQVRIETTTLKATLAEEQQGRKERKEYESLSKHVNRLPSRQTTEK